jgi:hypothetical protein
VDDNRAIEINGHRRSSSPDIQRQGRSGFFVDPLILLIRLDGEKLTFNSRFGSSA